VIRIFSPDNMCFPALSLSPGRLLRRSGGHDRGAVYLGG
jgi:hypothetical protein